MGAQANGAKTDVTSEGAESETDNGAGTQTQGSEKPDEIDAKIEKFFEAKYGGWSKKINKELERVRRDRTEPTTTATTTTEDKKPSETPAGLSKAELEQMLDQRQTLGKLEARFTEEELEELEDDLEGASIGERIRALKIASRGKKSSTETDEQNPKRGATPNTKRSERTAGAGDRGGVPKPRSQKEWRALSKEQRAQLEKEDPSFDPSDLPTR